MTSSATPPFPPTFNTQELANAAAGVVSDRKFIPRPLRTSQSFRLDEGYSGEETPIMYDDGSGQDPRTMDFKLPPWMAGLNDALREGWFYSFYFFISGFFLISRSSPASG